jgi:energy-coupling factor transporter ATP-binding protein EcfA2
MKKSLNILAASAFISLSLSMHQNILGADQVYNPEQEYQSAKKLIETRVDKYHDLLDSSRDKDIVVFLGKTGSGKSTLINYLNNIELKVNRLGNILLEDPSNPLAMPIGTGGKSKTSLPQFIESTNGRLFYDMPGFYDSKGVVVDLVNAIFIKTIIENAKSAKLVLMLSQPEVDFERGAHFVKFLQDVGKFLEGQPITSFSCLIVMKSLLNPAALTDFLKQKANGRVPALASWIQDRRVGQMFDPARTGDQVTIDQINPILEVIERTNPTRMKVNISCMTMNPLRDPRTIKTIYVEEMRNIASKLVEQNIKLAEDRNFDIQKDIRDLKEKKIYFGKHTFVQHFSSALDQSSFIKLLKPVTGSVVYDESWQIFDSSVLSILLQTANRKIDRKIAKLLFTARLGSLEQQISGLNTVTANLDQRIRNYENRNFNHTHKYWDNLCKCVLHVEHTDPR